MADKKYIDRPPRIEPQIPSGVYTIPNPPDTEENVGQLMQQAFLPMIMIFGYILASLFGQGRNMVMMVPMLLSVVATVVLAFYTHMREKKQREAAEAAYKRRIGELRLKMESEHEQQRIYYYYNHPNPDKTLGIAKIWGANRARAKRKFAQARACGSGAQRSRLFVFAPGHQHAPIHGGVQNIGKRKD
jgi:hypothetical protein